MNIQLAITALVGLSSVLIGSYAEHSLREQVSEEMIRKFMTGLRYHQNYSIVLLILSLVQYLNISDKAKSRFSIAFWIFLFAVITFCASVYLFVISNTAWVSYIAPVGGISLMLSWLYLAYCALRT